MTEREEFRELWTRDRYHAVRHDGRSVATDALSQRDRERMREIESKVRSSREYRTLLRHLALGDAGVSAQERRDLQAGSGAAGAYAVAKEQFSATMIRKMDDLVYVRGMATKVLLVYAETLGIASLEDNPADAAWTTELGIGSDDTAMNFGKRALTPHPMVKSIKVSKKLLRTSGIDIEALISDRFAYKFAIPQEKAFLIGNGAQQPLGVFTASAAGIDTSRDVSEGNTATQIQLNGLQNALFSIKESYRRNACWIFHRTAIQQIALLKDGDGKSLIHLRQQPGQFTMLLGLPVLESEYAPNTFTTGQYVGIVGDFSHYWIADSLELSIQRLVEVSAATNQDVFVGRMETDGMPVVAEAFARVALA